MRDCPKSPTRRHEAHVTIPVICQHCRDLLPRRHAIPVPIALSFFHDPRENTPEQEARRQASLHLGWNTTAHDPDGEDR